MVDRTFIKLQACSFHHVIEMDIEINNRINDDPDAQACSQHSSCTPLWQLVDLSPAYSKIDANFFASSSIPWTIFGQ